MRQTAQARAKSHPAYTSAATPKEDNARLAKRVEDYCIEALAHIPPAKIEETARQWLAKTKLEADDATNTLQLLEAFALAGHLLLFTPSLTGATPIERFIRQHRADANPEGRLALDALAKASFRLLRLTSRISPETFFAADIASRETLTLFDTEIPDGALGATLAARIAPLPDGGFMTLGPLTPLDAAALAEALSFVREGRGLSNPQRCAAAVYKHVMRHGGLHLEGVNAFPEESFDDIEAIENKDEFDDLDRLAFAIEAKNKNSQEPSTEDMSEARRLTSFESLAQALTRSVLSRQYRRDVLADVFSQLAFIMMETYDRRAAVGAGGEVNPLQSIAAALDRAVAERRLPKESRALYEDLRRRLTMSWNMGADKSEKDAELARVLQRIQGLRAKTVDQGCTEQEALASAKKVAELLDRYGLSLGEVEMREQACEGVGVETGRKRRAPFDDCVPSIALFCDCKVWVETTTQGAIRYVFFGLPADVEAAHYLYDLIALTFSTETARYKSEDEEFRSTVRREGARSFQIGLAHGIAEKLKIMKSERDAAMRQSTGCDLMVLKTSVIEEELEKLGLDFHAKATRCKRRVETGAYEAGRAAGRKFEPRRGVAGATAA
jgi:hypothetical protein